ncbi:MAG: hypothetical protein FWD58_08415 [Firmicutes bacterium]|nr:hypothetical protein [Bacillota bacterium]
MSKFSRAELEAAQKAFLSSKRKIEKVRETLSKKNPLPKPQLTLAIRNLDALHIALGLIEKELNTIE